MSRSLKFRAWDKKTREIFPVASIDMQERSVMSAEDLQIGYNDGLELDPPELSAEFHRFWEDIELMQYTGLKDNFESDIWESDIVKIVDQDGFEQVSAVGWDGSFHVTGEISANGESYTGYPLAYLPGFGYRIQVIGNIYENPELLEDK